MIKSYSDDELDLLRKMSLNIDVATQRLLATVERFQKEKVIDQRAIDDLLLRIKELKYTESTQYQPHSAAQRETQRLADFFMRTLPWRIKGGSVADNAIETIQFYRDEVAHGVSHVRDLSATVDRLTRENRQLRDVIKDAQTVLDEDITVTNPIPATKGENIVIYNRTLDPFGGVIIKNVGP